MKSQAKPSVKSVEKPKERYFSSAIGNALRILEMLHQAPQPISLVEASRSAKLPKSSVFRILRTLEISGYVKRTDGERFVAVAAASTSPRQSNERIIHVAQKWMRQLSQEFRETISLALRYENRIEAAAVIDSVHKVSMGNSVGDLIPPHASSLGKCITAYQTEEKRDRLVRSFTLVRFTPNTIVDESAFQKELELIRTRGYATDVEESSLGGYCLSAPIFAPDGQVIAAISISMPKMRFTNQDRLIAAVKEAAQAISIDLASSN